MVKWIFFLAFIFVINWTTVHGDCATNETILEVGETECTCNTFLKRETCKKITSQRCGCLRNFIRDGPTGQCLGFETCPASVCPCPFQRTTSCIYACESNCEPPDYFIKCNFFVCNAGCECNFPKFVKNLNTGLCLPAVMCDWKFE